MKKVSCLLLIAVMAVGLFGCSKSNNELFTDEFFEDVVSIDYFGLGSVSGKQMEPVIKYLKGLKLTETDERIRIPDENGDNLYGIYAISFSKDDGAEIHLLCNSAKINGLDNDAYSLADENEDFIAGLKEAFNKAHGKN